MKIRTRHSRVCASHLDAICDCTPSYEAKVWDGALGRALTKCFAEVEAAEAWRERTREEVGARRTRDQVTEREEGRLNPSDVLPVGLGQPDRTDQALRFLEQTSASLLDALVAAQERPAGPSLREAYMAIQPIIDLVRAAKKQGGDGAAPLTRTGGDERETSRDGAPVWADLRSVEINPLTFSKEADHGSEEG